MTPTHPMVNLMVSDYYTGTNVVHLTKIGGVSGRSSTDQDRTLCGRNLKYGYIYRAFFGNNGRLCEACRKRM